MFLEFKELDKEDSEITAPTGICWGCENACWLKCHETCSANCKSSCSSTSKIG